MTERGKRPPGAATGAAFLLAVVSATALAAVAVWFQVKPPYGWLWIAAIAVAAIVLIGAGRRRWKAG